MRKMQVGSLLVLIAALAVMSVNPFAVPLPDWAVRIDGIVMMLAIAAVAFGTVRQGMKNE